MSSASDEVRNRLDGVVDRAGLPEWVDTAEMKAELFKVVDRLLKAEHEATKLMLALDQAFNEESDRARGVGE